MQDGQIWVYELARDTLTRQASTRPAGSHFKSESLPVWTPDGEQDSLPVRTRTVHRAFSGRRRRQWRHGETDRQRVHPLPKSWSADGQLLSFGEINPTTGYDIWVLDMKDRKAVPFLRTPFYEVGVFSPDGRWMAYSVDLPSSGADNTVYVQAFPVAPGKYQISQGNSPLWSRDGKQLSFPGPGTSSAVNVTTEGGFAFTSPVPIPRGALLGSPAGPRRFDFLADGRLIGVVGAGLIQTAAPRDPADQRGAQLVRGSEAARSGAVTSAPLVQMSDALFAMVEENEGMFPNASASSQADG